MRSDQKRWDERFKGEEFAFGKEQNPFLKKHIHLLPKRKALDLASGEGRNAVFLAQHGFDVDAVDISDVGLKKAQKLAKGLGVNPVRKSSTFQRDGSHGALNPVFAQREINSSPLQAAGLSNGVKINIFLADLDTYKIEKEKYDLIANFYFLKRSLIPKIKKGIKKGGRVIFETYILEHREISTEGPKDRKYYLKPNELLRFFKDFRILFYREGIFKEGGRKKAVASLIAQKI